MLPGDDTLVRCEFAVVAKGSCCMGEVNTELIRSFL